MEELADFLKEINYEPTREHVQWLNHSNIDQSYEHENLNTELLSSWVSVGEINYCVAGEYAFCDPRLLDEYLSIAGFLTPIKMQKPVGSKPPSEMLKLNLFEGIGREFFSTRSGIKASNLDSLVNFIEPSAPSGEPLVPTGLPINYVDITNTYDVGFIEYMQWRKGELARGFAFELDGTKHNFMWHKLSHKERPKSELYRNVIGENKDSSAIQSFVKFVRSRLEHGAHLVYSDGIDAQKVHREDTDVSEVIHRRYFMCKCIVALGTVAENGTFIIKLDNMLTPFTVGYIYLMYQYFREMAIIKPFTSRPWGSERYVVFRSRNSQDCTQLYAHLLRLNDTMDVMDKTDVVQLVPLDVLQADRSFFDYIVDTNNRLFRYQIAHLKQLVAFYVDGKRFTDQYKKDRIWEICRNLWKMPTFDKFTEPGPYAHHLNKGEELNGDLIELTPENFNSYLGNQALQEWCFVPIYPWQIRDKPTFFLGQGDNRVHMLRDDTWEGLANDKITLPPGTLVYGQLATENVDHEPTLHIIDVYVKEYVDVRQQGFRQRHMVLHEIVSQLRNKFVLLRPMMHISKLPDFFYKTLGEKQCKDLGCLILIPNHKWKSLQKPLLFCNSSSIVNVTPNEKNHDMLLGLFEKLLVQPIPAKDSRNGWRSGRSGSQIERSGWRSDRNKAGTNNNNK